MLFPTARWNYAPKLPFLCCWVWLLLSQALSQAETIVLKNGMQLEGSVGRIAGIANPTLSPAGTSSNNPTGVKLVIVVDDGLRRTFVPTLQVAAVPPEGVNKLETFRIPQRVAEAGFQVNTVGPLLRVTPFDEFGRRIYSMSGAKGPLKVVQGITEVTPQYVRVQGVMASTSYVWDVRLATSSFSREMLSKVLRRGIDPTKPGDRQRIVVLYLQADRMQDARLELEEIVKEFPDLATAKDQVETLRQMGAQRLIKEIKQRREAGQHRLAFQMSAEFPVEGVADATVLSVRDLNVEYEDQKKLYDRFLEQIKTHLAAIEDTKLRDKFQPFCDEIARDLNVNTLDRMADFNRFLDDDKVAGDQKVALAVSGWILGSGAAVENTSVAASLGEVRNLVLAYLRSTRKGERDNLLTQLKAHEGSSPAYLAKIVSHMKPPLAPVEKGANEQQPEPGKIEGLHELSCAGVGPDKEFKYTVQLPPEYDPYRRYPCILALHAEGAAPAQALDWWAGPYSEKMNSRTGQATRQGYIVLTPAWTREHQRSYEYSAREHAAILLPLRDALQRFAIDSDRIFLAGHSMGGDAAWDLGIAHPDLWAGVIPIAANADKFVNLYTENARYVPWYFVIGEKDGERDLGNNVQWDRYLGRANYDVTITEYLGRGHDHFYDDIQRIFEWMKLHQRNFYPKEFKAVTMRNTDDFFWWTEVSDFPAQQNVSPFSWPPPKNTPPLTVESEILPNNGIRLKTGARSGHVFLSPDMLDFEKKIVFSVNGKSTTVGTPSAEVLLEDVRTRGDRLHPFWIRVDYK